ncbi:MAG: glutamate synthase large subunit, partial [Chloroflexota bacterium]
MRRPPSGATPTGQPRQGLYDPAFEHDACGIGFVARVDGQKSHGIVQQALTVLLNLDHRGARGSEQDTGDGAGILLQVPHAFFRVVCASQGVDLPRAGDYGVGMLFLPRDPQKRRKQEAQFETVVREAGHTLLGWRTVPTDNSTLGATARAAEPVVRQVFIQRAPGTPPGMPFERQLFVIRRRAENRARRAGRRFYAASLSSRTIVYKGMLTPQQMIDYYPDLGHDQLQSALALVHSRFSTNTFPSWERAHPNRYLMHNGEINTLRGNVNWMRARQARLPSRLFGTDTTDLLPVIDESGSDSAMFDNCLELLTLAGRSLPHAVMMMIPEPWSRHEAMDETLRAFYEYHSCLMEPWDGPAAIAFSDGDLVGAVLDRNGLRPARYVLTRDRRIILASEAGVLDIEPEQVLRKGRLQPGRLLLVDTRAGAIISDEVLKRRIAGAQPYGRWLQSHLRTVDDLPPPEESGASVAALPFAADLTQHQQAFGYTFEDLRVIMAPMAARGAEAIGSMGDDTPLAVLSDKPQPLFNYFKQLFAQVTNPPIDAIREELVMATEVYLGAQGDLLDPTPTACRRLKLPHPILTDQALTRIRRCGLPGLRATTLSMLFPLGEGRHGLQRALEQLGESAAQAVEEGATLLILSDRGLSATQAAIPALLATSALHHELIRRGLRTQVSLLVETGEAREVHHFATLIGYGAEAINPYLALATIDDLIEKGLLSSIDPAEARRRYVKAIVKGVVKVISKMGISTIQSYHGAQVFEAVGLRSDLVERYFTGTPSRVGGADMEVLAHEVALRHEHAFHPRPANGQTLPAGGRYQWRSDGEYHLFNPTTVHLLQHAVRSGDFEAYARYAEQVDDRSHQFATLRGLLQFREDREPIPLDEVEPAAAIVRRFKTGAMSYGSISQEVHETLALAMNRLGGKSNTGEGGEDAARFQPDPDGQSRNSAIKQVASGRFGVTSEYLVNAQEIQIKMAQGAKPGEGGQLPGHKVYPWIARVRHATPGVGLISP